MTTIREQVVNKYKAEQKTQSVKAAEQKARDEDKQKRDAPKTLRREQAQLRSYVQYTTRLCKKLFGLTPEFIMAGDETGKIVVRNNSFGLMNFHGYISLEPLFGHSVYSTSIWASLTDKGRVGEILNLDRPIFHAAPNLSSHVSVR